MLLMPKNKIQTPMQKLTHGYEKFIKVRELKTEGKKDFDKAIKKATKLKERGLK